VSELSKHLQLLYIASSRRVASHLYMYRITTLMKFIRHVLLLTVTLGIFYRVCLRAWRVLCGLSNSTYKDTGAASIGDKSAWHVSGQTGIGLTQDKQNQAFPENTAVRTE